MATVLRIGKLRVMIYSRDHPPPHVHVVRAQGNAKILVDGPGGFPRLEWNLGLSRRDLAMALAAVADHRERILVERKRIHEHTSLDPCRAGQESRPSEPRGARGGKDRAASM
ncbi:MAG: DUF4160 domain-containing protein [Steroidobacteraceae bacterium]